MLGYTFVLGLSRGVAALFAGGFSGFPRKREWLGWVGNDGRDPDLRGGQRLLVSSIWNGHFWRLPAISDQGIFREPTQLG